ncbi:MAG: peptidase domain-containing ABC transporter [Geminicoccaceae bacterium]
MPTPRGDLAQPGGASDNDPLLSSFIALCAEFDLATSDRELRAAATIPANGADAATLYRLADHVGLSMQRHMVNVPRLESQPPPYILASEDDAWLVRGRKGDRLLVMDMSNGSIHEVEPATAADASSTLYSFTPCKKEDRHQGLWRRTVALRLRPALIEIIAASVFINLMALATPLFMMTIYNKVINHGSMQTLDVLTIGMVSLFAFELLMRGLRGHVMSHTGSKLDLAISTEVVRHILSLPLHVIERMPSGMTMERLRQLDQLRQFLTGHLPLLTVDLAFVGFFLAALFLLSPTIGMVTLATMPGFVLISALAHKRQHRLLRQNFRAVAGKSAGLAEMVGQALTVKALGIENEMQRRFDERQVECAWTAFKASSLANLVASSAQTLQHVAGLVIVYLGARMIMAGELSIGALVACTILSARALSPMRQIFFAWNQVQQVRESFRRLDELFTSREPSIDRRAAAPIQITGQIRLEHVSFRYTAERPLAIRQFDLTVESGTMLAIIGAPGSGKSTLARLIAGLEPPTEGRVFLDGHDLSKVPLTAYRDQIGMVPQEVQLFSGTIAENIAIAADDGSFARIVAAAKFVGLHDIVQGMPQGYDTMLGERGIGLSIGQRQLVAIARAIVRNPRLIILDEATSALDAASEKRLLENIRRSGRGRTVLLITHRKSVAELCDRVLFIHEGRLAISGAPREVLDLAARFRTTREPEEAAT